MKKEETEILPHARSIAQIIERIKTSEDEIAEWGRELQTAHKNYDKGYASHCREVLAYNRNVIATLKWAFNMIESQQK